MFLATDHPGIVVRCRIETKYRDLSRFRRHLVREMNQRRSAWVGWIASGPE
jgi:hypothetical protein